MSVILFKDTVCGHPTTNAPTPLALNTCFNPVAGQPSFTVATLPLCANRATPLLLVSPEQNCQFPKETFVSSGVVAVKNTAACHNLRGREIGSMEFICPL
ncbi:Uu.00g117690.m01.CDS01 [Anthostomella pinea]|uniref:Uu.00g117690.m01.CDS01 n=1 Tax=Anthostomella pinea TaxID=933095 RepID=A0AAI8VH82_9PEZI|nr:Uu.00g117690.m01.CDS01 [Anthostomella pinea]